MRVGFVVWGWQCVTVLRMSTSQIPYPSPEQNSPDMPVWMPSQFKPESELSDYARERKRRRRARQRDDYADRDFTLGETMFSTSRSKYFKLSENFRAVCRHFSNSPFSRHLLALNTMNPDQKMYPFPFSAW